MPINWSLVQPVQNPGDAFNQSFRESQLRGALQDFSSDPTTEGAGNIFAMNPQQGVLAQQYVQRQQAQAQEADLRGAMAKTYGPEGVDMQAAANVLGQRGDIGGAMAMQSQLSEQQRAQLLENREEIGMLGQLAQSVTDQATYDTALAAAAQYGLDISQMPPDYESARPQLAQFLAINRMAEEEEGRTPLMQNIEYLRTLNPDRTDAQLAEIARRNINRPIVFQGPGGGQFEYDPTSPGVQGAAPGAMPEVGAIEDGYRFRGGDPASPDSWEPVSDAPGTFP